MIETFSDEFFNRIEDCVNTKAFNLTRYIYMFLAPTMNANETELSRFRALQNKLESYTAEQKKEGTQRLLNWIKDSIQEIEEKMAGRKLSLAWESVQVATTANL